jgi:replicative superfamily II helicase
MKEQPMKPENNSKKLLSITQSKAKMWEYNVPIEYHIKIQRDPAQLFSLVIGLLGDVAATINRGANGKISEQQTNLPFSSYFFDAYLQSKLTETLNPYLELLGSASYYLCDLPGSAKVLAERVSQNGLNLECQGLETLLLWLLQTNYSVDLSVDKSVYQQQISSIAHGMRQFWSGSTGKDKLLGNTDILRKQTYEIGSPRQLLFGDVIAAIIHKKLENSCWQSLPLYSGITQEKWTTVIKKESFIKEMWPAQHLLGKCGVLQGKSAVVQMPTSTGKTKSIELIIRSAFLAGRTSFIVLIAPFRALCTEIKNALSSAFQNEPISIDEFSDVLQIDYDINALMRQQQIVTVTPEKFLYILRHNTELASKIGLVIFDEGHQFDNGNRGITYELLLTSLLSLLKSDTQKVLISAVIDNASDVSEWLNKDKNVVDGNKLNPTYRTLGFASWRDTLGRIEFVNNHNIDENVFYVPRVLIKETLDKKPRERKKQIFPDKKDSQSIAIYLGLKLVPNGAVAIFSGRKDSIHSICKKIVDCIERKYSFDSIANNSNVDEMERISSLYVNNLGSEANVTKCAKIGIFSHHGNVPHGIRLAVEYAMRKELIRFIICTSTLAQGVNLPIRYLIIANLQQGQEFIRSRDYHNLAGRAGRAGMYTEGTILFAEPHLYDDKRESHKSKWKWQRLKEIIESHNNEVSTTSLLSIFEGDDQGQIIDFDYEELIKEHHDIIAAIESFLLTHWKDSDDTSDNSSIIQLADSTFASFLTTKLKNTEKQKQIRYLFKLLAENIKKQIPELPRRRVYGRTLYGVSDAKSIEQWIQSNIDLLCDSTQENILNNIWELFSQHIHNKNFEKFNNKEILQEITNQWILGNNFYDLLDLVTKSNCRIGDGTSTRYVTIDHIVDICENGIAYDGGLLVGAICEFIPDTFPDLVNRLQIFQKRIKYGLPFEAAIALHELGFSDRVIAQEMAINLKLTSSTKEGMISELRQNKTIAENITKKYPMYFQNRLESVIYH